MKKCIMVIVALIFSFISVNMLFAAANTGNQKTDLVEKSISAGDKQAIKASYMKLPLSFIKNEGQKDKSILFYEQGNGHTTVFTNKGISHSLGSGKGDIITLTPLNASSFTVEALDMKQGKVNYFIGKDQKNWKTNIPTYGAILYKGIYPGIDMKVYGTNNQMEYDLIVSPGADLNKIRLSYTGAKNLSITKEGDLAITLSDGSILQKKPVIYQTINNTRKDIAGKFVLANATTYRFEVGSYDAKHSLVIDPVLAYSTYLGGSDHDLADAIAVDSSGNAYVAGDTYSTNFPTQNPYQGANAGHDDAFVTKFNPSGSALVYSTYLGGSGNDYAYAIAVDSSGNAYVAGSTSSTNFPTQSPYQTANAGGDDAFVTKLNSEGSALVYSTYLGGSSNDYAYAIAVDSSGNAYVAGSTSSTNFPTQSPYQTANAGGDDAFVTKFNPAGSALVYSTHLGGSGDDYAFAIAVDSSGNAYVAGTAYNSTDFPTQSPYQGTNAGGVCEAFVTKLNPSGSTLVYSTYLGGSGNDYALAIAVDSSGNAYVAGDTYSTNFPTQNPYQGANAGHDDAFVTKFNPSGSALVYSTYLGGSDNDYAEAIAVDSSGNAYVAGRTVSSDFPTHSPYQGTHAGGYADAFVTKINPAGSALVYSTYLGGSGQDGAKAIAVDSSGNAYVAGNTYSTNFPTQSPYQGTKAGGYGIYDAFVTKFYATTELYANFTGAGIWKWDGNSWSQVTPNNPDFMVASGSDLYGSFTGGGIWKWDGSTWSQVTPNNPEFMVTIGSDLYGSFTGAGIWKWDGSSWTQATPNNPQSMVTLGSDLYGSFAGAGIWKWDGSSWTQATPNNPELMVATSTTLYGSFTGGGIWKWDGSTWSQATPNNPQLLVASGENLYGSFAGAGIWKWDGSSWTQATPNNPQQMVASESILYGSFTGGGIWQWDGATWTQLTPNYPVSMVTTNISTWYRDQDADGYGVLGETLKSYTQPVGYAAVAGDCNDNNASIHPGATEVCYDGIDNNCDGQTDEGCVGVCSPGATRSCPLQFGVCMGTTQTCGPGNEWIDCNYGPYYHPNEVCDGKDNDCDGQTDEGCTGAPCGSNNECINGFCIGYICQ